MEIGAKHLDNLVPQVMDQSAMTQARLVRSPGTPGSGGSLKLKVLAECVNIVCVDECIIFKC